MVEIISFEGLTAEDMGLSPTDVIPAKETYPYVSVGRNKRLPKLGSKAPNIGYMKIYNIAKGRGIHRSLSRLSKFYVSEREFEDLMIAYGQIRENDPSSAKYVDLMRAVADTHDFNYEYIKTDKTNLIKVWDNDGVEWQFPVKRGRFITRTRKPDTGVKDAGDSLYMPYHDIREGKSGKVTDIFEKYDK